MGLELLEQKTEQEASVVDFEKAQLDDYVEAYRSGANVEFEAFSPYIADHDLSQGKIDQENLTNAEIIGIEVTKLLRRKFPDARMISLYDEYNTFMPDSSLEKSTEGELSEKAGMPTEEVTDEQGNIVHGKTARQLRLDAGVKEKFRQSVQKVLEDQGAIDPENDVEGEDYLLVSEAAKVADAEVLVKVLEEQRPELISRDGQAITFKKEDGQEITLRNKSGDWRCEALDASSYIKPENKDITHLVVLSENFRDQQDNVWAVLKSLGIEPTNYHNIYFPEDSDPREVAQAIESEIDKHL